MHPNCWTFLPIQDFELNTGFVYDPASDTIQSVNLS
jgi:hypothetical protein